MPFVIKIFIMKLADLPTPVHSIVTMFDWVDIWVPVFLLTSILFKLSTRRFDASTCRRIQQNFCFVFLSFFRLKYFFFFCIDTN